MILKCKCESEFQDKKYGRGMRVHNQTKKQDGRIYRCTICENERTEGGDEPKKKSSPQVSQTKKGKGKSK